MLCCAGNRRTLRSDGAQRGSAEVSAARRCEAMMWTVRRYDGPTVRSVGLPRDAERSGALRSGE